jgi:hypothetical protein
MSTARTSPAARSIRVACSGGLAGLGVLLGTMPAAQAAGWTQAEGAFYAKAWSRAIMGSGMITAQGENVKLGDAYRDVGLNLYGEYGLTSALTLVGFAQPFGIAGFGEGDNQTYVGALGGGVRLGHALGRLQLAAELRYGYAPDVGTDPVGVGVAEDVPFVLVPTVNTHRVDAELQAGMGLPFGWWSASAGVRTFSAEGLDPTIIGFAQLGWQINPRWVLDLHLNLNQPTGDVVITNVLGAGQTAYLGVGVSATWWFVDQLGLHLGVEGVARAESNAATPSLTLGLEARGG